MASAIDPTLGGSLDEIGAAVSKPDLKTALTAAQTEITALQDNGGGTGAIFTTDTNGLVPASGANTGSFLRGDGEWAAAPGTGDVVGPASVTNERIALFNGVTGKLVKEASVGIAGLAVNLNDPLKDGLGLIEHAKHRLVLAQIQQIFLTLGLKLGGLHQTLDGLVELAHIHQCQAEPPTRLRRFTFPLNQLAVKFVGLVILTIDAMSVRRCQGRILVLRHLLPPGRGRMLTALYDDGYPSIPGSDMRRQVSMRARVWP